MREPPRPLTKIEKLIKKQFPDSAVQYWTEWAAEEDFEACPEGEEDKILAIRQIITKNLKEALNHKNEYIRTFAQLIQNRPKQFGSGLDHLAELNKTMPIFEQKSFSKSIKQRKKN